MNAGRIHDNVSGNNTGSGAGGGGVAISGTHATFIMNAGEIDHNTARVSGHGGGGGLLVTGASASVTMNEGARIHHNHVNSTAIGHGGGVSFNPPEPTPGNGMTFTINGGRIDNNTLLTNNGFGGGVRMVAGTFTMNSGSIDHNEARATGAQPLTNSSVGGGGFSFTATNTRQLHFNLHGGAIEHNVSHAGGGGGGIFGLSAASTTSYSYVYIGEEAQINYNQCRSNIDNLLFNGGGMALRGARLDITLAGRVHGNTSNIWAGGFHIGQASGINYSAHRFTMLPTARVTHNVAGWDGGGMALSAGQDANGIESYVIYGGLIAYNYTINPIGAGGGLLMPWTSTAQGLANGIMSVPQVTIHGATFRNNGISQDPSRTGGRPARNSEGRVLTRDGGAIYAQSPHDVIRRRRLSGQITPTQNRYAKPAPYGVVLTGRYHTEFIGNEVIYNGGAIFARPFQQEMTAPVRIPGETGQLINIATSQRVLTPWLPYIGPDSPARFGANWINPSTPPAGSHFNTQNPEEHFQLPYYALRVHESVVFSDNVAHRGPAFPPENPEVTAIPFPVNGNSVYPLYAPIFTAQDHLLNNYDINFWTSGIVEKEVSHEEADVGDRITYTIRVRNTTPFVSLEHIQVVDPIDVTLLAVDPDSIAVAFMDGTPMVDATHHFDSATGLLEVDVPSLYRPEWWDDLVMPYLTVTFEAYVRTEAACLEIENPAFLFVGDLMRDFDEAPTVVVSCDLPTTDFEFLKVDYDEGLPLAGATFSLYRQGPDGNWITPPLATLTSGANGIVRFSGLRYGGTYRLVETAAPDGFETPAGYWIVTVSNSGEITVTSSDDDQPSFNARR